MNTLDDEEKIETLWWALNQLLTSIENKCVTIGDCNQARNALAQTKADDNGHPWCKTDAQFGVGA